jgi:N-acetylmuramoyl-L-alanine amidase
MNSVFRLFAYTAVLLAMSMPAHAQGNGTKGSMALNTVVIDPGHGGKDAGSISKDKKTYEKNIALDVSKRLAQKISAAYPEMAVLMTRSNDTFVELENRALFANKAGADLFICVHVNSVDNTRANGYSIHCLGQSRVKGNDLYSKNLDLVKRENSVILLEDGYETTYQGFDPNDPQSSIIFNLMQNAHLGNSLAFAEDVATAMSNGPIRNNRGVSQDPFWVLWRTAMPSVLIEIGFLSNQEDLAIMRTEEGRDQIAGNIFKAFCTFKSRYDGSITPGDSSSANAGVQEKPAPSVQEPVKQEPPKTAAPAKQTVKYGVQVLVTSKEMDLKDPFFCGYTPTHIKAGKYNKYVIGVTTSQAEAKKTFQKVQKSFPDAFIIKITE